jgi:hypothetical protein
MSQKQTYSQTVKSGLFSNTVSQTTSTYGATGEFFSQYRGASAGYSLRNLSNQTKNVVRVRRDSDDNERDFSATEINDGSLENWVNNQAVRPLDIQEMVGGERTGDKLPVKGAYSLRRLSGSYTGPVVEVTDWKGSAKDFTALEVNDGTMEAWTVRRTADFNNKAVYFQPNSPHFVRAPIGRAFGGTNWGLKFQFVVVTSGGNTKHGLIGNARTPVVFLENANLKITGFTGSSQVEHDLGAVYDWQVPHEVELNYNAATTTLTGTLTNLYDGTVTDLNTITNYDSHYEGFLPDDYIDIGVVKTGISRLYGSIKDIEISINGVVRHKYAGHGNTAEDWIDTVGGANGVIQGAGQPPLFNGQHIHARASKLYDQSGNGRHMIGSSLSNPQLPDPNDRGWSAVQAGALICNSGTLYRDAEGNPRISFAPWNSYRSRYKIDFGADEANKNQTVVMVHQSSSTNHWQNEFLDDFNGTGERMLLDADGTKYRMNSTTTHDITTNQAVFVAKYGWQGSSNPDDYARLNGVSSGPFNAGNGKLSGELAVGYSVRTTPDNAYRGYMSELIFYEGITDSDAEAIEANIADTYGISNIPTGGDQANGYVSVWYDQSKGNNNLIGRTIAEQPWIVKDGSLTKNSNGLPTIQFEAYKYLFANKATLDGEDGSIPIVSKGGYLTTIYAVEHVRSMQWTESPVSNSDWIYPSPLYINNLTYDKSYAPHYDRQGNERIFRIYQSLHYDEANNPSDQRSWTNSIQSYGGTNGYTLNSGPLVNTVMYKPRDGGPYDASNEVQQFDIKIAGGSSRNADELGAEGTYTKSGDVWVKDDYTISLTTGRWSLSKGATELIYAENSHIKNDNPQYPWKVARVSWLNTRGQNNVYIYHIGNLDDGAGNKVWGRDSAKIVSWSSGHPSGSDVSVSYMGNSTGATTTEDANYMRLGYGVSIYDPVTNPTSRVGAVTDSGEWNISEWVFFPEALDASVQSMKANVENYYKV